MFFFSLCIHCYVPQEKYKKNNYFPQWANDGFAIKPAMRVRVDVDKAFTKAESILRSEKIYIKTIHKGRNRPKERKNMYKERLSLSQVYINVINTQYIEKQNHKVFSAKDLILRRAP